MSTCRKLQHSALASVKSEESAAFCSLHNYTGITVIVVFWSCSILVRLLRVRWFAVNQSHVWVHLLTDVGRLIAHLHFRDKFKCAVDL